MQIIAKQSEADGTQHQVLVTQGDTAQVLVRNPETGEESVLWTGSKYVCSDGESGPTRKFPDGSLGDGDEGELRMSLSQRGNTAILHFGKSVTWIGLRKQELVQFAAAFIELAQKLPDFE